MEALKQFADGLYWQPFDPSTDTPLKDRYELAQQSVRPWSEFFDISEFNLPPFGQITARMKHNIETFLYNYFVLVALQIVLFSITHTGIALCLVLLLVFLYLLFIKFPEDIEVGQFNIDSTMKKIMAGIAVCLALFLGHILTFVISVCVFVLIVVGIHTLIRDDSSELTLDEGM
ncbi:PRA1 family protein G2 [Gracilariopsis chorda]|uniref:PRA1 family protein n=1 Tax=Gracilariopsis chorda TaxID=448386 RepID=A0A2V3IS95_9FLOR|nr:PRA1 family protein G2 [Gracilariopsis chorda]|eukprot:PXF44617.1 PRA1 family protein G2 [Gracilariopsis chorda]